MELLTRYFTETYSNDNPEELAQLVASVQEPGTQDYNRKIQYVKEFQAWLANAELRAWLAQQ